MAAKVFRGRPGSSIGAFGASVGPGAAPAAARWRAEASRPPRPARPALGSNARDDREHEHERDQPRCDRDHREPEAAQPSQRITRWERRGPADDVPAGRARNRRGLNGCRRAFTDPAGQLLTGRARQHRQESISRPTAEMLYERGLSANSERYGPSQPELLRLLAPMALPPRAIRQARRAALCAVADASAQPLENVAFTRPRQKPNLRAACGLSRRRAQV